MTSVDALLRRLEETRGDTHAQAAVAAEFVLTARPEGQREALRAAFDAAAVLRWFDAALLGRLLGIAEEEARQHFDALAALPFVERYRGVGVDLRNVHEATRLGWRRQLAHVNPERWRELSARAAARFAGDLSPTGRIEWIYHLLGGAPERGAGALEQLAREWGSSARPEDRHALAAALAELESTNLVEGRSRAWVLLVTAWNRASRGESAQLGDVAHEALRLARSTSDAPAEADAQQLLGDALEAQGKLTEAQVAFGESLAISRRLAEQDPTNAGWQRDLAVAHSRSGDVFQAQGRLAEAQVAFGESLAIFRRLAEQDPTNAGWQRDLAVAYSRSGDVFEAQGRLAEAQVAFGEYLAISRRLAEQDPTHAGWQRGLAVACWRVARLAGRQERHADALPLYEEASRIFAKLVEHAPGFVEWAQEREWLADELAACREAVAGNEVADETE